jgi:hypothetical protein
MGKDLPNHDRRNAIKAIGTVGTGLVGLRSITDIANADGTSTGNGDTEGPEPEIYPCPDGCSPSNHITINAKEIADNVSAGEFCSMVGASCGIITAAAAADIIPGDEVFVGLTCGSAALGCAGWAAFKDEHKNAKKAKVFRAQEPGGDVNEDDYIVVPSNWNW